MNIFIGIPSRGNPAPTFVESLKHLETDPAWEVSHATVVGDFVPGQRELLARMALDADSDLLIFFDDDMVLPPEALVELARLCADPTVGVVGGLYYTRDGLKPLAVSRWRSNHMTSAAIPAFGWQPTEVDGVGFGCAAISMPWLRRLEAPFFSAHIYIEREARRVRLCNEDYLFCERIRRQGGRVLLHGGLRCGHYDRATQRIQPERWEPPETTGIERMLVRHPNGAVELVAYDDNHPEADDGSEACTVEYVWSRSQPR